MRWLSASALTWPDYSLALILVGGMICAAFRLGKLKDSTGDFFLAGRKIPVWAAILSFVATETSALTIIGVPAVAFRENWNYVQFFIGSAAARAMIAFAFIPAFYRLECVTIYEYLLRRFGPATRYAASALFFVTRLLAAGVRLMAACVALAVILGLPVPAAIAVTAAAALSYNLYGGIKAVVWANVLQAAALLAAGLSAVLFLAHAGGGLYRVVSTALGAGRLDILRWSPADGPASALARFFSDPNLLYVAVLNGFVGSLAAFGTDQEMMQKLLTLKTRRQSQKTLLLSISVSFFVLVVFLSVGTGLFSFYQWNPGMALPKKLDAVYPNFVVTAMPAPLRGLFFACIAMIAMDAPFVSLSTVFVNDIYRPLLKSDASESHYLRASRWAAAFFAAVLAILAYALSFFDKMLWLAFKIGGVTLGSLLGVYLMGIFTRRKADKANVAAMLAMAGINAILLYLSESGIAPLGWSWLVVIGTAGTFGLAWALAPVLDGDLQ